MENLKIKKKRKNRYMTGEDIDMFREKQQDYRNKRKLPICDTHMDGA